MHSKYFYKYVEIVLALHVTTVYYVLIGWQLSESKRENKMKSIITATKIKETTYYKTTMNGVEYIASTMGDQWFTQSRRIALGRFNVGTIKYYPSLEALASNCKAFAGLDELLVAL